MVRCMCVCVCLSVTSRSSNKTAKYVELILAWRLPSAYPTLCLKKTRVTPKIRILPSGTLFRNFVPNFGLGKFPHGKPIAGAVNKDNRDAASQLSTVNALHFAHTAFTLLSYTVLVH